MLLFYTYNFTKTFSALDQTKIIFAWLCFDFQIVTKVCVFAMKRRYNLPRCVANLDITRANDEPQHAKSLSLVTRVV